MPRMAETLDSEELRRAKATLASLTTFPLAMRLEAIAEDSSLLDYVPLVLDALLAAEQRAEEAERERDAFCGQWRRIGSNDQGTPQSPSADE